MEIKRAIEILDPEHREHYESIEPVMEACRMGMEALRKQIKKQPFALGKKTVCARCGFGNSLYSKEGDKNNFCGLCGQAIDWGEAVEQ